MKKSIFTILFAFTAITAVLAREGGIDSRVEKAFKSKFSSATDVTWRKSETNYQVTFTSHQAVLNATFSGRGKLLEVKTNISPLGLPLLLQKSLKTYCDGRWVIDLVEISKGDVKAYFVTLESPDNKIMMESVAGSNWEMISVLNKDTNSIINI
jgi:hypothetical protein